MLSSISMMVLRNNARAQFVGKGDGIFECFGRALDLFILTHEPIGGPYAVESPSKGFKLLLPQPITIARGITGMIGGAVALNG